MVSCISTAVANHIKSDSVAIQWSKTCFKHTSVLFSEHIASIIAGMLRNCLATQRQRLLNKFTENDHEKVCENAKKSSYDNHSNALVLCNATSHWITSQICVIM